jgi:cytochrome c553
MQSNSRLMVALSGFALVVAVGLSSVLVASQEQSSNQAVVAGRKAFLEKCAACHGLDARGGGHVAPTLKSVPMDLSQIATRHKGFSQYEVQRTILGEPSQSDPIVRDMPHWGHVFRQEGGEALVMLQTHNIVSYLESIQQR